MLHPAAFCHSTMDGIGNDLCNRRRSLFFLQTLSIAQLRSRRAQVFHFWGLHLLLLMDCDRFVLVRHQFRWKACFWPRSLSATGGQSHLIRFGFGGRYKKWRSLSYLKIFEVSLQNSVINPVKTFFLWWADFFNVILTRSSKVECSTGSNNHLRSTDHFRWYWWYWVQ